MATRPRRSTANLHPGKVIIENTQKRRTVAQIQADKDAAEAAVVAAASSEATIKASKVARVAIFEDHLRLEDQENDQHAARPDLHSPVKLAPKKKSIPANKTRGKLVQVPIENLSKNLSKDSSSTTVPDTAAVPDSPFIEATIDEHSSSDGGLDIPIDSAISLAIWDDDDDDGHDDEMGTQSHHEDLSDNEIEAAFQAALEEARKKKNKKAPSQRGSLRKEINDTRKIPPTSGALAMKKRKSESESGIQAMETPGKRPKKAEPAGLQIGWKKQVKQVESTFLKKAPASKNEDEFPPGEFDEDEPEDIIRAAAAAKKNAIVKIRNGTKTSQPRNIKINDVPAIKLEGIANATPAVGKKGSYTTNSLPLPSGPGNEIYLQKWKKMLQPTLISWASTIDDPFGTNSQMNQVIFDLWATIYPTVGIDGPGHDVITEVAGDALTNWRSGIGKDALVHL
ncbi:hypothetical protein BD779DRAFT_1478177, partial [Infundibulicybe gibba]